MKPLYPSLLLLVEMNSILLRALFCFGLFSSALHAAESSAFEAANHSFQVGDFASAAATYEKCLTTEGPRAAIFYNLGNAYQRLGQYGPAILAYERARLITPRDPDLLANLALARKAANAIEEPTFDPRLDAVLSYLSRNEWSWLVVGATLFLGGLALIVGAMGVSRRGLRPYVLAAAGLAGIVILAGAAALYLRRDEANRGVVLSLDAAVRLSPFDKAEALGVPGCGRFVRLGEKSGDFIYVDVLASQLHGWIASKDVALLVPHEEPKCR
jgi:tetratricopeptide (TPR) repeat protein